MKRKVFSGIKPSGKLHLGNYLGALSQWVNLQNEYESVFCIVDMHALTTPIDPKKLREQTRSIGAWYIAAGIDPSKSIIFVQSDNPDHANLSWILNCYTSVGQLNRMTQYKEKKEKQGFISAGLYDYPVLMAADILLYDTTHVPVGEDQKQHIELTREVAARFNRKYGNIFTLPQYMPPPTGRRIMSLQRPLNKMSKSEEDPMGTINLQDSPDIIRKKVLSAVTDSGNEILISPNKPAISNLATIFMALSGKSQEELDKDYTGKGYKKFKEDLAEVIISELKPLQEKYHEIKNSQIGEILQEGAKRARKISKIKLEKVKEAVGLG
jgi:tryptophanyl-tRNA synthetase